MNFWVFGYGSLMWNPGFPYIESQKAKLIGYHRAPCIYSYVHRGTPEKPGVVLGLAPEGECVGIAFKVKGENEKNVREYLRDRELITKIYREIEHPLHLESGEIVEGTTYVVDTQHKQYVQNQKIDELMPFIKQGCGKSGNNDDYMKETYQMLKKMDINDDIIGEIVNRLVPKN